MGGHAPRNLKSNLTFVGRVSMFVSIIRQPHNYARPTGPGTTVDLPELLAAWEIIGTDMTSRLVSDLYSQVYAIRRCGVAHSV